MGFYFLFHICSKEKNLITIYYNHKSKFKYRKQKKINEISKINIRIIY